MHLNCFYHKHNNSSKKRTGWCVQQLPWTIKLLSSELVTGWSSLSVTMATAVSTKFMDWPTVIAVYTNMPLVLLNINLDSMCFKVRLSNMGRDSTVSVLLSSLITTKLHGFTSNEQATSFTEYLCLPTIRKAAGLTLTPGRPAFQSLHSVLATLAVWLGWSGMLPIKHWAQCWFHVIGVNK